jgi:Zinc dependent phospholipase C
MTGLAQSRTVWLLAVLLLLPGCRQATAYSLFTHERLIDLTWETSIVPLLLSRYPTLTSAELEHARAYAYGGSVVQDIGYYPFGDSSFSNLTHYVRSGDFVVNLFRNAHNADELAFAIGALSHYIGDSVGHSEATNLAVPIEFPKLRAEYGPVVSYAQGRHQHVQTELAFDIDEIAYQRVPPLPYLHHVGIQVPVRQLALAFYQTYGLSEDFSAKRGRRFNVGGYRFAVRTFIPRISYALALLHRHREPPETNTPERLEIDEEVAAVAAENHWRAYRHRTGIGTYALAGLIFVLPKIGPLKLLAIKGPTAATEADYTHSVCVSESALRRVLARFTPPRPTVASSAADTLSGLPPPHPLPADPSASHDVPRESRDRLHPLPNRDLDTGYVVQPGGYSLTDSTYADLLHRLTRRPSQPIPPGIKEDIQAYYANQASPNTTKRNAAMWAQVQADLVTLSRMPTSTEPEPYPTYGDDAESAQ